MVGNFTTLLHFSWIFIGIFLNSKSNSKPRITTTTLAFLKRKQWKRKIRFAHCFLSLVRALAYFRCFSYHCSTGIRIDFSLLTCCFCADHGVSSNMLIVVSPLLNNLALLCKRRQRHLFFLAAATGASVFLISLKFLCFNFTFLI